MVTCRCSNADCRERPKGQRLGARSSPKRSAIRWSFVGGWSCRSRWQPRRGSQRPAFECWSQSPISPGFLLMAIRPILCCCKFSLARRNWPPSRWALGRGLFTTPTHEAEIFLRTPGLLGKYTGRVLIVASGVCAVHCRFCFRRHFPYTPGALSGRRLVAHFAAYCSEIHRLRKSFLAAATPLTTRDSRLAEVACRACRNPSTCAQVAGPLRGCRSSYPATWSIDELFPAGCAERGSRHSWSCIATIRPNWTPHPALPWAGSSMRACRC